uniref:CTLH domain-containing protein n=1 Tax=Chlamydomonas euryale TaxID=1486919 RepID=A0A7R9VRM3_9CHLO|mmetsp:Transcript_42404/g.127118  ORF Transcript_42404/g.127118 Transcript_42404/m.127118 type:complete len:231 (+) Transcript_42404:86-778(+)
MGREDNLTRYDMEAWESKLNAVSVPKEDMNRLIMNFLVTEGYVEAARAFKEECGTEPNVDLETITNRMEVRKAVQRGDVDTAIDKVNDLNPEILESQAELFFHLQQQRLIELIRDGNIEAALDFAEEYLAPHGEENPKFLEELEKTVALLAFENAKSSPVGDLLEVAQRQKTASELNAAILQSQCVEREARLPMLIKMMLWAQKELDEKVVYPHITDLATGQLADPKAEA